MDLPGRDALLDIQWLERMHTRKGMKSLADYLRRGGEAYGGPVAAVADAALTRGPGVGMLQWNDETEVRHALAHKLLAGCWSPAPGGPRRYRQENLGYLLCVMSPAKRGEYWAKVRAKTGDAPPPEPQVPSLDKLRLLAPIELACVAQADGIWTCEVSPNGRLVAAASRDGDVTLWDVASGLLVARATTGERQVRHCGFSPDGNVLVSLHGSGRVGIWNVPTLASIATFEVPLNVPRARNVSSYTSPHRWRRFAISPDSAWLAVASWSALELWDLHKQRHGSTIVLDPEQRVGVFALTFTCDRHVCIVADGNPSEITTWDVIADRVVTKDVVRPRATYWIGYFTPDGQHLVAAGDDLDVYRLYPTSLVASVPVNIVGRALALSSDGTRAATFGGQPWSTLRVWSLPTLTELARCDLMERGCWDVSCALAFTPDAGSVVAAGWDGVLRRIRLAGVART